MGDPRGYWMDPRYWRWRWARATSATKLSLLLPVAALFCVAGYLSAKGLAGATQATVAYTPPVPASQDSGSVPSTVARSRQGQARDVTPVRQQTAAPSVATQTVVQTVAVPSPGRERIVTVTDSEHTPTSVKDGHRSTSRARRDRLANRNGATA